MQIFTYYQASPITTWTVTHNLNAPVVVSDVNVIGPSSLVEKLLPQEVVITDSNTLTITFSSAESGYVRIIGGQ